MLFMPKKEIDQFFRDDYNVGFVAVAIIFQIMFFIICGGVTHNVTVEINQPHNAAAMFIHDAFPVYWYWFAASAIIGDICMWRTYTAWMRDDYISCRIFGFTSFVCCFCGISFIVYSPILLLDILCAVCKHGPTWFKKFIDLLDHRRPQPKPRPDIHKELDSLLKQSKMAAYKSDHFFYIVNIMIKIPTAYNTKGLNDLAEIWSSLVSNADINNDAYITELAEEILTKLKAPVNSDNMIIVINKLKEQIKSNQKETT